MSNLQKVYTIRHGAYDRSTKMLNTLGREQAKIVAVKIQSITSTDLKVAVITSPLTRALETAEIVATTLNTQLIVCSELEDDKYGSGDYLSERIQSLSKGYDIVVAICHFESPAGIINAFAQQAFQKSVPCFLCQNGNGLMIDLTSGIIIGDLLTHE